MTPLQVRSYVEPGEEKPRQSEPFQQTRNGSATLLQNPPFKASSALS